MCDNCETCQKLFSSSSEERGQAETNQLKPCNCKDKDCPFLYCGGDLFAEL